MPIKCFKDPKWSRLYSCFITGRTFFLEWVGAEPVPDINESSSPARAGALDEFNRLGGDIWRIMSPPVPC